MVENLYELTAKVLSYPGGETAETARELQRKLCEFDPEFKDIIAPFIDYLSLTERGVLEEGYTSTFDVQAICPLEVGYTLFGEDYKRGEFLVRMSDLHAEYKTSLNASELGDYLPNIFMLLKNMPEGELKKDFIEKILLPSIAKMLKSFEAGKAQNPFAIPLRTLNQVLLSRYSLNPLILETKYE